MSECHAALLDASVALTTGIIAGAVTLAAEADAPLPDWIKVTPAGRATTRDGRSFTFDPARLASRFGADAIDLAVDTDHSVALLASKGEKPNVVGYVKAVEARPDGTYGRVAWNDPAEARATLKTHRYVSPTIHHEPDGTVTWLHTVSLVSAPAIGNMPALAHVSPHQDLSMKAIAKALGLTEDATEDACLAAIAKRPEVKPLAAALGLPEASDAAACLAAIGGMVPRATHEATLAALTETTAKLSTLTTTTRKADTERLVDDAIRAKKIVPAQRSSYLAMCATEAGTETFRGLMAATMPMFQPSGLDGINPSMLAAQAAERASIRVTSPHAPPPTANSRPRPASPSRTPRP